MEKLRELTCRYNLSKVGPAPTSHQPPRKRNENCTPPQAIIREPQQHNPSNRGNLLLTEPPTPAQAVALPISEDPRGAHASIQNLPRSFIWGVEAELRGARCIRQGRQRETTV